MQNNYYIIDINGNFGHGYNNGHILLPKIFKFMKEHNIKYTLYEHAKNSIGIIGYRKKDYIILSNDHDVILLKLKFSCLKLFKVNTKNFNVLHNYIKNTINHAFIIEFSHEAQSQLNDLIKK